MMECSQLNPLAARGEWPYTRVGTHMHVGQRADFADPVALRFVTATDGISCIYS